MEKLSLILANILEIIVNNYSDDIAMIIGALSDVRITKGKALWTSNFTPPRRSGAF